MSDYKPVSCELHSRLELYALRQRPVQLQWRNAAGRIIEQPATILDLITRRGEEFVVARLASGAQEEIRLDRIAEAGEL